MHALVRSWHCAGQPQPYYGSGLQSLCPSLLLLPFWICVAFLFAPVLAFRFLLFPFVPSIYLQAVSAWFNLLCTETVVQKLYFYSASLLMVVHPTSEAGLNLCRTLDKSLFFPSNTWLIPYPYLDRSYRQWPSLLQNLDSFPPLASFKKKSI